MTILDRFFLGLTAAALLVFAGFVIATMLGNVVFVSWLQSSDLLLDGGMVVLLTILLSVYLLILITRQEGRKFIVHQAELGEVRLNVSCVKGLIREAVREISGIKEAEVVITDLEELKVRLRVRIFPDYHIPELSEELQRTVRDYLNNTAGILVQQVEVVVHGIADENKPRLAL